jgi:hypothetical protein
MQKRFGFDAKAIPGAVFHESLFTVIWSTRKSNGTGREGAGPGELTQGPGGIPSISEQGQTPVVFIDQAYHMKNALEMVSHKEIDSVFGPAEIRKRPMQDMKRTIPYPTIDPGKPPADAW